MYPGHPDQQFGPTSYSQHGEDLFLVNVFKLMGIDKPSYLDLGAHHPIHISNTHLLYTRGSRGINVEANPNLWKEFISHRPDEINLNFGVGIWEGMGRKMTFYMIDDRSGLNSFCREEIERIGLKPTQTMEIEVIPLMDIIRLYSNGVFPDLLCTDIEGWDHEVLKSADFSKSAPKVICSEIRPYASTKTIELLKERGYFVLTRVMANLIFVQRDYLPIFTT